MKIAIIGTGNLGLSIIQGLVQSNQVNKHQVYATRRNLSKIGYLSELNVLITSDNKKAVEASDIIILALKSYSLATVFDEIGTVLDPKRHIIISLAAGITIEETKKLLQKDIPLYRAMPNTASAYCQSITLLSQQGDLLPDDSIPHQVFNLIGTSVSINEELMDAGTVLGASGIAYVMRFMRAMAQGGIEIGFDAKTAAAIVTQVTRGAAELLAQGDNHPETEIDKVTTPKGCTIVGLNTMEHNGFSSSLIQGIVASAEKLGKKHSSTL